MTTPTDEPNPTGHTPGPTVKEPPAKAPVSKDDDRWNAAFRSIVAGNAAVAFFSVLLAVLVGSLLIMFTDDRVRETFGY